MNILYTLNSGNPGGMEQHVLDLVSGMVKKNHTVYVWCKDGAIVDWYKNAGAIVEVRAINTDIDVKYIRSLWKYIREKKINVVHAHELKAGVNTLIGATMANVPCKITHVHTPISEWQYDSQIKKLIQPLNVLFYSTIVNIFGTREIALTESRKQIKITEGIKVEKLEVIPNALKNDLFDEALNKKTDSRNYIRTKYNIPDDAFVIGNISRMTEEKGQDLLMVAFTNILKTLENKNKLNLLLAGGGKLEENYRHLVTELGLNDKIIITGIFPQEDLAKFYTAMDLFVFPSLAEGFGIVLIEAMYNDLPILASDLRVLHEVGGNYVSYFKKGDLIDLTQKLTLLYNDVASEKYLKTNTMSTYIKQKYTMEKFIDAYENLYNKFLKETT